MASKEFTTLTTFGVMTKFDPVQDTRQIHTVQFLQACTELAGVLDDLGSGFSIPKKDMLGNIKKIDEKYKTDPAKYETINSMLEEDSNAVKKPTNTVVGVIWLRRGLDFIRAFLLGLCQSFNDRSEEEDLRKTVLTAYELTLRPYHGKMVQFLFSNVTRFVPYRSNFIKSLMKDPSASPEQVISDIDLFLPNLISNVDLMENLLNKHDINCTDKA